MKLIGPRDSEVCERIEDGLLVIYIDDAERPTRAELEDLECESRERSEDR